MKDNSENVNPENENTAGNVNAPCTCFEELISRSVDNDLTESEKKILDDHTAVCSACRMLRAEMPLLSTLIKQSFPPVVKMEPTVPFGQKLIQHTIPLLRSRIKWAAAIAAVLISASLYVVQMRSEHPPLVKASGSSFEEIFMKFSAAASHSETMILAGNGGTKQEALGAIGYYLNVEPSVSIYSGPSIEGTTLREIYKAENFLSLDYVF